MSRGTVVSLVYFGCFSLALFMCTPAFVMLMLHDWHFSESSGGIVISAGIIGNTLGGMIVGAKSWRIGTRTTLLGAVAAMIAGYLLASRGGSVTLVALEVLVAGVGSGVLSGVSTRSLTYSSHPHRYLSMVALAQNLTAALLMGVALPFVGERWGAHGAFAIMGLLVVPCVFMVRAASDNSDVQTHMSNEPCNAVGVAALLASTLTYYLMIGLVWTFLGTLGAENGIQGEHVDRAAGASNLLSLVVCLLSPWLERSHRMRGWSLWSISLTLVGIAGMVMTHQLYGFAAWMLVMNAGWTLNGIVLQCLFPDVDPAGRFVGVTSGLTNIGYATGAYVGGTWLESHTASSSFLWALVLGVAAALVLLLVRRKKGHVAVDDEPLAVSGSTA